MSLGINKKPLRVLFLIATDIFIVAFSTLAALYIRMEFDIQKTESYIVPYLKYLPISIVVTLGVFYIFQLYKSLWEYASIPEYSLVMMATAISVAINFLGRILLNMYLPGSSIVISWFIMFSMVVGIRIMYRMLRSERNKQYFNSDDGDGTPQRQDKRIMIIGAGEAGNMIIREIQQNRSIRSQRVVCVIDDDRSKIGSNIHGIKIVGCRYDIPKAVIKYTVDEIIFTIPSASPSEKAAILNICSGLGVKLRTTPYVGTLVKDEVSIRSVKDVNIEDLLGRDAITLNMEIMTEYVRGKVVLVTGGGGSIGSELCRQLSKYDPKQLIIFDVFENNAYYIQNELKRNYPSLDLVVLIGSVRDEKRMDDLFNEYRPDIVFHAAAHKHVPLMEDSPNEAIKNNVFGTLNTVRSADKYGTQRFIMISTDKAVNPTNVMGATKRICEMIVQTYNNRSKTEYVAVRFGNVLGSDGSVIPLFKDQITAGGPVLVTHPDIIRYFMTIPEAVSLVLSAGGQAKGGEIFVLDMGKPVKILDLAENLIRLSGYTPYEDINIEFTGLRPGEKLYEELLMSEEGLSATQNKLIHIGHPIQFDEETFLDKLESLYEAGMNNTPEIRTLIYDIVPTYMYIREEDNAKV